MLGDKAGPICLTAAMSGEADGNKSTFWIKAAGALRLLRDSFVRSIAKLDGTAIRLSVV